MLCDMGGFLKIGQVQTKQYEEGTHLNTHQAKL